MVVLPRLPNWSARCTLADLRQLLGLLDRLVDSGKSVIFIEHHQAVMGHADWVIDLGPGAGHDGGRIVFEGTPADLAAARSTLTGEHLAALWDCWWEVHDPQGELVCMMVYKRGAVEVVCAARRDRRAPSAVCVGSLATCSRAARLRV
jgi:hypothetical protein